MAITDKYGFTEIPVGTSGWATTYDANMALVENHLHTHLRLTLGETVSQYDVLYINSDGKAYKASKATFPRPAVGMAIESGVADDVINAQRVGKITNSAWDFKYLGWAVYLSATAGGVTQVETSETQVVGIAYDAHTILLRFGYAVAVAATTTTTTTSSTTSTTHTTTSTESGTTSSTASTTSTHSSTSSTASTTSTVFTTTTVLSACPGSNASFYNEDCADISDWVDGDTGNGISSQVTFDGKSCFKFDSGTVAGGGHYAQRERDVGTFGNHIVVEIETYFSTLGTLAHGDKGGVTIYNGTNACAINFCTDGLWVYDGTDWNEVGTNIVQTGTWQTWVFDIGVSGADVVDVYLNGSLQQADVSCNWTTGYPNGVVRLLGFGTTTAHRIWYANYIKVGDDCT